MKKTKLKLKKSVWITLIILLFLGIAIYSGIKIKKDIDYKKTNEYKLIQIGYSKDDIKLLEEKTSRETITNLLNLPKQEFLLSLIKEEYYLKKNLSRYLEYQNKHVSESPKNIVALVNTNRDHAYYDFDHDTDLEKDNLILTNKYYKLQDNYIPDDLVSVNNKYYYGENHKMRKVAYQAFIDMWNEAYKQDIYLIMNSSFRTYESQAKVYDSYKNSKGTSYADSIAARPGYSEHQTGLTADIFSKTNTTMASFKDSVAHIWLQDNSYKYGFIERYQEGKEEITGFAAESWHYRYVGIEVATYIHEHNITFDEYYAYFIEK